MKSKNFTEEEMNAYVKGTMVSHLGIEITEIGKDYIKGKMPVDKRTIQPYGLLHGGASAALAESLGSLGAALKINREKEICVGIEVNANHIKSVSEGWVFGTATPIHTGNKIHVWETKIVNENDEIVSVSRLTVSVLPKR